MRLLGRTGIGGGMTSEQEGKSTSVHGVGCYWHGIWNRRLDFDTGSTWVDIPLRPMVDRFEYYCIVSFIVSSLDYTVCFCASFA
jgi:hypothetical protein